MVAAIALLIVFTTRAAYPVRVQGDRWLTVEQLSGSVSLIPYQRSPRPARMGDRLSSAGDRIITGPNASVRLAVDLQTGFVSMAENSQVQVQTLSITNTGGRVTELRVDQGQVRLRVRPLSNPATRLEIHTPAGVSGVRGTDFGVSVQSDGRTGVATQEGSVITSAAGESITLGANWQTSVYPGEPPEPPEPLRDDPTLFVERLSVLPESSAGNIMVRLSGYTDDVNLLKVNGDLKRLTREGRFNLVVPLFNVGAQNVGAQNVGAQNVDVESRDEQAPNKQNPEEQISLDATVITPLGTEQNYRLVLP